MEPVAMPATVPLAACFCGVMGCGSEALAVRVELGVEEVEEDIVALLWDVVAVVEGRVASVVGWLVEDDEVGRKVGCEVGRDVG